MDKQLKKEGLKDYTVRDGLVVLKNNKDFLPELIFDCGQCFRWDRRGNGRWYGVAFGKALELWETDGDVYMDTTEKDFLEIWYEYFDLGRDYEAVRGRISSDSFTAPAAQFGRGIRILRQDGWEALCSFIISQCNNITRIKGIIGRLCELYGEELEYRGETYHAFPSAEVIAGLDEKALSPLRAGYRAKYILSAARDISTGKVDLRGLCGLSTEEAMKELTGVNGVGVKVASCALLFGCGRTDAFPVDVWMKRAIEGHYGGKEFDYRMFGEDAGIAQQYIFHYMRHLAGKV
ncbi:MAG: DNA-3-methyladenine glycosylase 2 family protein [Oscillospiraceae bacterium]|jgi:N-glycosylase/DNA lyase|nr:DNA-3-methyladenine glycosylase 2 family protein [Oscillospiraceae bacterium]